MKDPLHVYTELTIDEILCDEIVQAMMAADRVDRDALEAMLAEVAQSLSARTGAGCIRSDPVRGSRTATSN